MTPQMVSSVGAYDTVITENQNADLLDTTLDSNMKY